AGPGGAPRVLILDGSSVVSGFLSGAEASPLANFFVAGNSSDRGGVRVVAKLPDGDTLADVVVGSGEGDTANVRVYQGESFFTTTAEPPTFQDIAVFGGAVLRGGVFVG